VKQAITKLQGLPAVHIHAPISGIILADSTFYNSAQGGSLAGASGGGAGGGIAKLGSEVKQGQQLAVIGSLDDGITISVKINEMDIEKIHADQKASVTSSIL